MEPQRQCQICQKAFKALHPESGYRVPAFYTDLNRFVELGSWDELKRNHSCPTCSTITSLFNAQFKSYDDDFSSGNYEFWLFDFDAKYLYLRLESKSLKIWPQFVIKPWSRETLDVESEHGAVLLDPDKLELRRVLQWLETCNAMHGACNRSISPSDLSFSGRDMYLISISKMCLVKANGREKYVTLSYVWGAELPKFTTTKSNFESLQERDKFSSVSIQNQLPGTVKRAMHFTLLLKVEYLWIDCLCIVQDDPIHVASQIDSMAKIYSNSYLTLCAADGVDAESGLRGIPGCTTPRKLHQDVLAFTDGSRTSHWIRSSHSELNVWRSRGWTFQEDILSRRALYFEDNGLRWRCQEFSAEEQKVEMNRFLTSDRIGQEDTLWPRLGRWDSLLSSYLRRTLKYEEDILPAFSGIMEVLSLGMPGGFLFGLPEQFFDVALLWVPEEHLSRRRNTKNKSTVPPYPSWSWAGWKGATTNQIPAFGLEHERSCGMQNIRPRDTSIFPCVTWFKLAQDTFEKVRVTNDYAKYRDGGLEGTITLPIGWSASYESIIHSQGYYYMYDRAPDLYTFWYPIPVRRNQNPEIIRQWAPTLYCKAWRGYLERGDLLPKQEYVPTKVGPNIQKSDDWGHRCLVHSLRNRDGEWAGVLYPHNPTAKGVEKNEQCELILISGGFVEEDVDEDWDWIPEWNYKERPRLRDRYYFYHVLLIEWHEKIAYRKGLGRVVRQIWDALPKDEVEVLLG